MATTAGKRVLPGFSLSLGYAMLYLSLMVLIPLGAVVLRATELTWGQFWDTVWTDRAVAAYKLTFGASLIAALVNGLLGFLVAWVFVRYDFPLKKLFDALVDVPFALPTAVAGLVYASLYVESGWLGQYLVPLGFKAAFTPLAIVLVLVFTGFPFVVRTVQPVLENLEVELEEAAAILGASRWQTFRRVLFPTILPAMLTGISLAFARALGEYGSVIFVSGNKRFETEIAPLLIVAHLQTAQYAEATAISVVLLVFSFLMLILINLLEKWSRTNA